MGYWPETKIFFYIWAYFNYGHLICPFVICQFVIPGVPQGSRGEPKRHPQGCADYRRYGATGAGHQ